VSQLISVQLEVLGGLLAELRALGVELGEERQLTAATGRSMQRALTGPVGEQVGLTGTEWTAALGALAARALAVAATLDAALVAYRVADVGLAGQIAGGATGRVGTRPVPR
jgi:hypothetical protein